MIYANVEMLNALVAEKQRKPLIIEDVVIELPQRSSVWRKRCAAMLRELAELLESPRQPILKSA